MKKFMRIALVFALAGAALVGCTKDYSGDISDLNKEVSAIQSTLTSLQTSIQGAQSAADAAAATANTALSAAKAAATADDLKAVQTALAAAATSADLTAVDDKYAAYIPAIKAAATASDLEALETAIKAAIAATDVKVADLEKALEAYAKKADLDAAAEKILALETNYIDLEARVAKLEAAEKEIRDLIAENKAGIEANAEDIAALQKKVEELLAQGDGAFSVEAISGTAKYSKATWKPETSKAGKERLEKLAKVFSELAELKKDDVVETFGHINFIVNPSSVVLDDTYTFTLFDKYGENSGVVLGNPTKGSATKAGLNVWDVEVQKPAYDEDGEVINFIDCNNKLALVVENAEGVYAQTGFNYKVLVSDGSNFSITENQTFSDTFVYDESKTEHSIDALDSIFTVNGLFKNYFIVETVDPADEEEFGIVIEGSKISFTKAPTRTNPKIAFAITAVGVNGKTDTQKDTITLGYKKSVAPKIDLDAAKVTLGYDATKQGDDAYYVPVKYSVESFGFSALEWKTVYDSLKTTTNAVSSSYINENGRKVEGAITGDVIFFDKDGKVVTGKAYSEVKAFGFNVNSSTVKPETYTVIIATRDGSTFVGKGEVVVENPEACPVKLAEALCDANGVLQIVGSIKDEGTSTSARSFVEYNLTNALVFKTEEASLVQGTPGHYRFVDEDKVFDEDSSWVKNDSTLFRIPVQGGKWTNGTEEQKLLYTPRNLSVKFKWFGNANNTGKYGFKAEAVSPIYDEAGKGANITIGTKNTKGEAIINTTIYYKADPVAKEFTTTGNLETAILSGEYVAGKLAGESFDITDTKAESPASWKEDDAGKETKWKLTSAESLHYTEGNVPTWAARSNITTYDDEDDNTNAKTSYVKGVDGLLIEVALKDAYDMGFLGFDDYMTYSKYDEDSPYTYYLTVANWNAIKAAYTNIVAYKYTYSGGLLHKGIGKGTSTTTDPTLLAASVKEVTDDYNAITDKQVKAQYDYFAEVINNIKFQTKQAGYTFVAAKQGSNLNEELVRYPYFTCANASNYTNYVTFNWTGKLETETVPSANDHITAITAESNDAGKATVKIPLTLNVEDKWGMTSKKEFEITVKVKE